MVKKLSRSSKDKIYAMAPSYRKRAESEIEEQLETSLRLYFQIRMRRDDLDVNHWKNNLRAALLKAIHANKAKINRGYWFDIYQASNILKAIDEDAFMLAKDHLEITDNRHMPDYSLEELFLTCGLDLPKEWQHII